MTFFIIIIDRFQLVICPSCRPVRDKLTIDLILQMNDAAPSATDPTKIIAGVVSAIILAIFAVVLVVVLSKLADLRTRLQLFVKSSFLSFGNGERTLINRDSFYYQRVGEHRRFVTSVVDVAAMLARHGLIVAAMRTFRESSEQPPLGLALLVMAVSLLCIRRLIAHWLLARVIEVAADVLIVLFGVIGAQPTNVNVSSPQVDVLLNSGFIASLALMAAVLLLRLFFITSRSCDIEPSANPADIVTFHLMSVTSLAVVIADAAHGGIIGERIDGCRRVHACCH
jgi:hypothetical protein